MENGHALEKINPDTVAQWKVKYAIVSGPDGNTELKPNAAAVVGYLIEIGQHRAVSVDVMLARLDLASERLVDVFKQNKPFLHNHIRQEHGTARCTLRILRVS